MIAAAGVWERLVAAGIVSGTAPPAEEDPSPWYVTAMLGVAAWLSALFLLAFAGVALSDLFRTATSMLVLGMLLCAAAIAVLRFAGNSVFATQLGIAASLAGQALVAFGVLDGGARNAVSWAVIAVFEAILVGVAPQYVHRVLATLGAAVALRMALGAAAVAALFPAVVAAAFVAAQGATPQRLLRDSLWAPVSTGLALALLLVIPFALLDSLFFTVDRSAPFAGAAAWAGTGAVACVFVASIGRLLGEAGIGWRSRTGMWALAGRHPAVARGMAGAGRRRRADRAAGGVRGRPARAGGPRGRGAARRARALLLRAAGPPARQGRGARRDRCRAAGRPLRVALRAQRRTGGRSCVRR